MKKRLVSILMIVILLISSAPLTIAAGDITAYQAADELNSLGLFRGTSDGGYELDRSMTRQEAIVMLIRLLGKEHAAIGGDWPHKFRDVSLWADNYVGYACAKELATGYSETIFGSSDNATAAQFITFVLRALGYSEREGDFSWRTPWELSDSIGLTGGEYGSDSNFKRADAVLISHNALNMRLKGGDMTLLEFLKASGVISTDANMGLTAAEISQRCSTSVFYIAVYSDEKYSYPFAEGSGFFITKDGIAVTNYHVIENARCARITMTSGESYNVTNVIYGDKVKDLAILRVDKTSVNGSVISSFPYLEMGNSSTVQNGDIIYTIGSPLGLQNTISNGIVSNSSRTIDGAEFIQITAAISPGSSGGALLDDTGKVIGITSASFNNSQNLNLAVPIDLVKSVNMSVTGTEFSKYFAKSESGTVKYTLKTSQTSITLKEGQIEKTVITHNYPEDVCVGWKNSNDSVAHAEWGNWVDQYNTELYLSGLKPGTATITIIYLDGTGSKDAAAEISVRVTE